MRRVFFCASEAASGFSDLPYTRAFSGGPSWCIFPGMSESNCTRRSPELMSVGDTGLLVVDVQERLIGSIGGWRKVVWNVLRLVDGAKALGLPVVATEQYPQGLGHTVPELAERLEDVCPGGIPEKMTFSSCGCPGAFAGFSDRGVRKILVAGIEAHVCVAQTVFDLMADGWRIYVAVDAVGSRFGLDCRTALARMDSAGATLTTTEAALFELCEVAGTPEFKEISRLVKQSEPKAEG